jgi:hypothetical protein
MKLWENTLKLILRAGMLCSLCFCAGCVPYYKLLRREFPQGTPDTIDPHLTKANLKTGRAYNQFSTDLLVDALLLSPSVRTVYAQRFTRSHAYDHNAYYALLEKQKAEAYQQIGFYIVLEAPTYEKASLDGNDPLWKLALNLPNGKTIMPRVIKEVELEPEIAAFFGKRWSEFKKSYYVSFSHPYPSQKAPFAFYYAPFSLTFTSPTRSITLEWNQSSNSKVAQKDYEDFYWV